MENIDGNPHSSNNSDVSDSVLFTTRSRGNADLAREIYRVKDNDPGATKLELRCIDWYGSGWRHLSFIVGQSTHLKKLDIWFGNFDAVGFGAGLQHNRSIESFTLAGINLEDPEQLRCLAPFLSNNPSLKDVLFGSCNMGAESIPILSNALASRSADSLERLNLSDNNFGDVHLDELVSALARNKSLRRLYLNDCGIGRDGCTSLAKLLENEETNLRSLALANNGIDDDCAIILAESLANNTMLRILHLTGSGGITKLGWSAMLALVFDSSSNEGVMKSNHTLEYLGYNTNDSRKVIATALGEDDASLLIASLELNGKFDKMYVARRKIIWGHARGDLNIGDSSIPSGFMPCIMSWFVDDSDETKANLIQYHDPPLPKVKADRIRLDSIYRIIRSHPALCKKGTKETKANKKRKIQLEPMYRQERTLTDAKLALRKGRRARTK